MAFRGGFWVGVRWLWMFLVFLTVLTLAVWPAMASLPTCRDGSRLSVATLNLLNKNVFHAAIYPKWSTRANAIARWVSTHRPHIFATQEGVPEMIQDLSHQMPDYAAFGGVRSHASEVNETSTIYISKDRFEIDTAVHVDFWLSEDPHQFGSIGWDASMPRLVTLLLLRDKITQSVVLAINVHLDHKGRVAKKMSVKLLKDVLLQYLGVADKLLLMGDFNMELTNPSMQGLFSILDPLIPPVEGSGSYQTHVSGQKIDHIFYRGFGGVCSGRIVSIKTDSGWPVSDHNMVFGKLAI